jgi:hypothetical protein
MGSRGGLRLGERGGGECERDPGGRWLLQEGWLLQVINAYCKNRYMHVCLSSSSLQALEDKEEGAFYSTIRPGIGECAEVVNKMVWRSFKKV